MKILVNGYTPPLVIADMRYGTKGYSPFMNIFITRKNIFICLDNPVYLDMRELYLYHGEACDFVSVERTARGGFCFDFGNLLSAKAFNLFPEYYDILFGKSESFVNIDASSLDIQDIQSSDYHYSPEEQKGDLALLEKLASLKLMTVSGLKKELEQVVSTENYLRAAELRDEIGRRSSV